MNEFCEETIVHEDVVNKKKNELLSEQQYQDIAMVFGLLSDATRVKIISCLFQEELCVCDISEIIGMSHSATSHQLRLLRQARLVKNKKKGKNVLYSLDDEHVEILFDVVKKHLGHKHGI